MKKRTYNRVQYLRESSENGGANLDNLKNLCTNLSDQNLKLENFITQNQTSFNNLNNQFKKVQQDILHFKNDIDKTIQQIEMEIERSQNLLTKWVSGANTKLMQEQIAQKRMALTNQVQKINDVFTQISQEIDKTLNDFGTSSQQIVADFKNTENQLQTISKANQTVGAASSLNDVTTHLQQSLKQAIDALNSARQGIEQQKVFNEINKSIDNLLQ
jgi:chromosome segregation ATPase